MKKQLLFITCAAIGFISCNENPEPKYIDLTNGKDIEVIKDKETGYMVNAETNKPVYLYVDAVSRDTFYGRTGKKVNRHVTLTDDGTFWYDDDDYVYKNGDYKVKTDDEDVKVKDGDYKKKTDDGDVKIKDGDSKVKIDKDGDKKIKNGDTKIKVDDGKVTIKKDD